LLRSLAEGFFSGVFNGVVFHSGPREWPEFSTKVTSTGEIA